MTPLNRLTPGNPAPASPRFSSAKLVRDWHTRFTMTTDEFKKLKKSVRPELKELPDFIRLVYHRDEKDISQWDSIGVIMQPENQTLLDKIFCFGEFYFVTFSAVPPSDNSKVYFLRKVIQRLKDDGKVKAEQSFRLPSMDHPSHDESPFRREEC